MPTQSHPAGAKRALDSLTGRETASARSTYLALLSSAPSDSTTLSTMSEVVSPNTSGYQRKSVTWSDPGNTRVSRNVGDIEFGPFLTDLPEVTHAALVTSASGTSGDILYSWALNPPRDPQINDTIRILDQTMTITQPPS